MWKFPEIVDIALPAEGVFHNLVWSGVAHAPSRVVFGALAKHISVVLHANPVGEGADWCSRGRLRSPTKSCTASGAWAR